MESRGEGNGNDDDHDKNKKYLSPEGTKMEKSTSLHGIHAQSSTETSGLGETITSGFSSQESIHSARSGRGLDPGETTALSSSVRGRRKSADRQGPTPVASETGGDVCANQTNFDDLFTQSAAASASRMKHVELAGRQAGSAGLQPEFLDKEWDRRSSMRSSARSHSSAGSYRSRSGSTKSPRKFLGKSTESAWTKWSRERKASFRRRLDLVDKTNTERERASTPVKKARQECLKFVHPDLEGKYLSEEDINYLKRHNQQRYYTFSVIEKSKKGSYPIRTQVQLSVTEWNILTDFWEHGTFVRTRHVGVFVSFITLLLLIISITNNYWISYTQYTDYSNLEIHEGLWQKCIKNKSETTPEEECQFSGKGNPAGIWVSCYHNFSEIEDSVFKCPDKKPYWQNAVIGLMIFAASFGFLAAVLSICGVFTTPLPKKIYYYHSAGELFLICALSTSVALIIFPLAIELDNNMPNHNYGTGYGLGWGGTIFFFAAALCMSLDDLVKESSSAVCCQLCFDRSRSNRTELQQAVRQQHRREVYIRVPIHAAPSGEKPKREERVVLTTARDDRAEASR